MDITAKCSRGWAERCAASTGRSCQCACGGQNHGKSRPAGTIGGERTKLTDHKIFSRPLERVVTRSMREFYDIVMTREASPVPGGLGRARANIPHRFVVHSPYGFEWGYAGSGPAELALNILAMFTTPQDAYALHQQFKDEFIVRLPKDGGTIKATAVSGWLCNRFREDAPPGFRVRESRAVSA